MKNILTTLMIILSLVTNAQDRSASKELFKQDILDNINRTEEQETFAKKYRKQKKIQKASQIIVASGLLSSAFGSYTYASYWSFDPTPQEDRRAGIGLGFILTGLVGTITGVALIISSTRSKRKIERNYYESQLSETNNKDGSFIIKAAHNKLSFVYQF